MLKRFKKVNGKYIDRIYGQERLAFAHSGTEDFYDMIGWAERGGYQGSVIYFYDFSNGNVYTPFEKERDVLYSDPAYADGYYYFLRGDFRKKKITLYRYLPEELLEDVTELSTEEVNLYNLRIIGNPVFIISQEDRFECYYPFRISFDLKQGQTVQFIEGDRIYIEEWVEEGWDEENDCATDDYNFYNKTVVKDFKGNVLSEKTGSLYQSPDGNWWIS